jgi:hypothetical protein
MFIVLLPLCISRENDVRLFYILFMLFIFIYVIYLYLYFIYVIYLYLYFIYVIYLYLYFICVIYLYLPILVFNAISTLGDASVV